MAELWALGPTSHWILPHTAFCIFPFIPDYKEINSWDHVQTWWEAYNYAFRPFVQLTIPSLLFLTEYDWFLE